MTYLDSLSRRTWLKGIGAAAAAGGVGTTLVACSSPAGSSSAAATSLNFGCTNFSKESLNPTTTTNAAWANMRYGVGECLFRLDQDMAAQPALAESFTVDDTHTSWVITLREGIKFSNGAEVTATKVAECFEYIYAEEAKGASATPSRFMQMVSCTPDDAARTLTFVTEIPYASLPTRLLNPAFVVLDIAGSTDLDKSPIGTGPYAITEFNSGKNVLLKRNEHYWNGVPPYEEVNIVFMDDSSSLTKYMALQAGDIDIAENITATSDLQTLREDPNYNVSETIGTRTGFSYLNQKAGRPLANEALRKAVIQAVDYTTIADVTVGRMYSPGYPVLPPTLNYGNDELADTLPYSPQAAAKLLDDAGIVDADGDGFRELDGAPLNLDYITYDSRNLALLAEAVAAQLAEIGIRATVTRTDADTEWNRMVAGEYDLASSNWMTIQEGEPYSFLANWHGPNEANYCGYASAAFDELYDQLGTELDLEKRRTIYQSLQQVLIDDGAVLVHGYYNSNLCSNLARVTGVTAPPADYYWVTTEFRPAG